jgi:hypothetical protein
VVSYRTSKASKKKVEELRSSFNQLVSRLSPSSSYMKVGYRHCVDKYAQSDLVCNILITLQENIEAKQNS